MSTAKVPIILNNQTFFLFLKIFVQIFFDFFQTFFQIFFSNFFQTFFKLFSNFYSECNSPLIQKTGYKVCGGIQSAISPPGAAATIVRSSQSIAFHVTLPSACAFCVPLIAPQSGATRSLHTLSFLSPHCAPLVSPTFINISPSPVSSHSLFMSGYLIRILSAITLEMSEFLVIDLLIAPPPIPISRSKADKLSPNFSISCLRINALAIVIINFQKMIKTDAEM